MKIRDWAMSGVEITRATKEKDMHVCASCVNSVIQTFSYFQEQIEAVRTEKANLQEEIKELKKTLKKQTLVMSEKIRTLQQEIVMLKKRPESSRGTV